MNDESRGGPVVTEEKLARIEAGEEHPPKPEFLSDQEWEMLTLARKPEYVRMAGGAHAEQYQVAGGEGLDVTQGAPVLLLTTIGRKSGNDVTTPLNYLQDGDDVIVVGSFAGLKSQPHWALNLQNNPRGWVQIKDRKWEVEADAVTGQERDRLWPRLTEFFPLWGHFQRYCRREFPVYILSPAQSPTGTTGR